MLSKIIHYISSVLLLSSALHGPPNHAHALKLKVVHSTRSRSLSSGAIKTITKSKRNVVRSTVSGARKLNKLLNLEQHQQMLKKGKVWGRINMNELLRLQQLNNRSGVNTVIQSVTTTPYESRLAEITKSIDIFLTSATSDADLRRRIMLGASGIIEMMRRKYNNLSDLGIFTDHDIDTRVNKFAQLEMFLDVLNSPQLVRKHLKIKNSKMTVERYLAYVMIEAIKRCTLCDDSHYNLQYGIISGQCFFASEVMHRVHNNKNTIPKPSPIDEENNRLELDMLIYYAQKLKDPSIWLDIKKNQEEDADLSV